MTSSLAASLAVVEEVEAGGEVEAVIEVALEAAVEVMTEELVETKVVLTSTADVEEVDAITMELLCEVDIKVGVVDEAITIGAADDALVVMITGTGLGVLVTVRDATLPIEVCERGAALIAVVVDCPIAVEPGQGRISIRIGRH